MGDLDKNKFECVMMVLFNMKKFDIVVLKKVYEGQMVGVKLNVV